MPTITLTTRIKAPIERVFDLARSIDALLASSDSPQEKIISGNTSGLINLGETVTWEASHLPAKQTLTLVITEFSAPYFFTDEMTEGPFKALKHKHHFESDGHFTSMHDEFYYSTGRGILGKLIESSYLSAYLRRFLGDRNSALKSFAEGERWREFLS